MNGNDDRGFRDAIKEAILDMALSKAISEGEHSPLVDAAGVIKMPPGQSPNRFRESFVRDWSRIAADAGPKVLQGIVDTVARQGAALRAEKLESAKKGKFYFLRIDDYYLGLEVQNGRAIFVRILHHKEITQYFLG